MPSPPQAGPLVDLLEAYHQCFYDRDLGRLADLYTAGAGFVYFDNHPDSDAVDLPGHLAAVERFLTAGPPAPLDVQVRTSHVIGDAGYLAARLRYTDRDHPAVRLTLVAERTDRQWRIVHLHYSNDPNDPPPA